MALTVTDWFLSSYLGCFLLPFITAGFLTVRYLGLVMKADSEQSRAAGGDRELVHVDPVQRVASIPGFSDIVSYDTDRRLPEGGAWGLRKRILRSVAFSFHDLFFLLNHFT